MTERVRSLHALPSLLFSHLMKCLFWFAVKYPGLIARLMAVVSYFPSIEPSVRLLIYTRRLPMSAQLPADENELSPQAKAIYHQLILEIHRNSQGTAQ